MILALIIVCALSLGFLFWASYDVGSQVYVKTLCRVKTGEKVVYLTFDDGPAGEQTEKVVSILKEHGAKAAFFLIGSKIPGNEALLKRLAEEGFTLGIHTMEHSWRGPFETPARMAAELKACSDLIEAAAGSRPRFYRPPFGVTSPRIAKALRLLGETRPRAIGWTVRTFDTRRPDVEHVLRRLRRGLRPGAIILMHEKMPGSENYVEVVLRYLETQGYRCASLAEI